MSILKVLSYLVVVALLALAGFLASTPWRVHGGRFVAEYLMLGGAIGLAALIILAITLIFS